jgi:4'-phosphopantetheinyl transferase
MPAALPFLRPWSKDPGNRCGYGDLLPYWTAHDAVTVLVDLGAVGPDLYDLLADDEKKRVLLYKSDRSRRRFVVSRAVLKRILSEILSEDAREIVLTRSAEGRVLVRDWPHVHVSLSYHGTSIAVTVGKRKLGSDLEGVRPIRDGKITASRVFRECPRAEGTDRTEHVIHVWTLVESCAKLQDASPYHLLGACSPFGDANLVSYRIDRQLVLSLASAPGRFTEVLVWLDAGGAGGSRRVPREPVETGRVTLPRGSSETGNMRCP